jgi:uncharacterized repeat protein (TIGR03833 family)
MDGTRRADIRPGLRVRVVLKRDQRSGRLTEGVVRAVLTGSATHPRGIKVRLETGEVGRVREILDKGTGEMLPDGKERGPLTHDQGKDQTKAQNR